MAIFQEASTVYSEGLAPAISFLESWTEGVENAKRDWSLFPVTPLSQDRPLMPKKWVSVPIFLAVYQNLSETSL